jgi:ribose transport system ATP-binding protein
MPELILEARRISKSFNNVQVLHGVDFTLARGEVHGLVGQNGAGKSTLMKILNGVYTKDDGQLLVAGQEVEYDSPLGARQHGISMVFQELSLISSLNVAQNVFLTREPRTRGFLVDDKCCERRTKEILNELGVDIDPRATVEGLSIGSRQIVEIAKALSQEAKILILDEPTASMSHHEVETLFAVIERLKASGISIVYISHHLRDLLQICDRVTVLRDGRGVFTKDVSETDMAEVIRAMLGGSMDSSMAWTGTPVDRNQPPVLKVQHLSYGKHLVDVSFDLWQGEVLGIAGLLGSGRTELLNTVMGVDRKDRGEVILRGERVRVRDPKDALDLGMALVPEDRRNQGLILEHSVKENILLPRWEALSRMGLIDERAADTVANGFVRDMNINTSGLAQTVKFLSGGNQQKVVISKSLSISPSIMFLNDPTFGIDIESKYDIMQTVREFANAGHAVIFISSEFEQLAALCDRVLVMCKGQLTGELDRSRGDVITEQSLLGAIQ